ncbi:hypothetical protein J5N97_030103 [Dioscorea zingiberensis]|uniref:C2H2-type domain-containing protein n=1 Tax=Dioscorea zingiberensis TaxID=325984 RepID=A0A9D5BX59_9LILI|nr:hypothetical protein J5N97_030103 [Dioscorea zingiberensis]
MAKVLMMLSSPTPASGRDFECKTCGRRFSSFQALGGHRASHKKLRLVAGENEKHGGEMKARTHDCPICGLTFGIGQALGGHMRRHRASVHGGGVVKKEDDGVLNLNLDLNFPPSGVEVLERRTMVFGIELVEKTPLVDCFH